MRIFRFLQAGCPSIRAADKMWIPSGHARRADRDECVRILTRTQFKAFVIVIEQYTPVHIQRVVCWVNFFSNIENTPSHWERYSLWYRWHSTFHIINKAASNWIIQTIFYLPRFQWRTCVIDEKIMKPKTKLRSKIQCEIMECEAAWHSSGPYSYNIWTTASCPRWMFLWQWTRLCAPLQCIALATVWFNVSTGWRLCVMCMNKLCRWLTFFRPVVAIGCSTAAAAAMFST